MTANENAAAPNRDGGVFVFRADGPRFMMNLAAPRADQIGTRCTNVTTALSPGLQDFIAMHLPVLRADEARHNILVCTLANAARGAIPDLRTWTLGEPGACALQFPGRPIALGDVTRAACEEFAVSLTVDPYQGVVGPDDTAAWFAAAAETRGIRFKQPMPQMIYALREPPVSPGSEGAMRIAGIEDAELVHGWIEAFTRDAGIDDPLPSLETVRTMLPSGRIGLWIADGEPVSMAGLGRSTETLCAIVPVYTPQALRGRGYAGSVVSALCDLAFARGRETLCLYTDLRNPASNRCYVKIGFKPVCRASHYARIA
jgi:ribosomal protein S18 acetylase RimI-like enzyme